MAKKPEVAVQKDSDNTTDHEVCGLIIPISGTTNHSEKHWSDMRDLLSRAIENASLKPVPVWINSSTDRVSERIVGNIFRFPVCIADISDQNPNVMLELGLRLASKKPTIVVMNEGEIIPFDVRDFHIHIYPPSLSIIEMEAFIENVSKDIIDKLASFKNEEYVPFLGSVVVDVVSPGEREVPLGKYVLDQLQELNRRVASIDSKRSAGRPNDSNGSNDLIVSSIGQGNYEFYVSIPLSTSADFEDYINAFGHVDSCVIMDRDENNVYFSIQKRGHLAEGQGVELRRDVEKAVSQFRGKNHAPRWAIDKSQAARKSQR